MNSCTQPPCLCNKLPSTYCFHPVLMWNATHLNSCQNTSICLSTSSLPSVSNETPRVSQVLLLNTSNWAPYQFWLVEMTHSICSSLKHTQCYTFWRLLPISHKPSVVIHHHVGWHSCQGTGCYVKFMIWTYIYRLSHRAAHWDVTLSRTCDIYILAMLNVYTVWQIDGTYINSIQLLLEAAYIFQGYENNALITPADIQTCCNS